MSRDRPTIAVTMGDPLGVGPEIIVKALADPSLGQRARFVILGRQEPLLAAAEAAGIEPFWWKVRAGSSLVETAAGHDALVLDYESLSLPDAPAGGRRPGPTREGGEMSFRLVEEAIALVQGQGSQSLRADAVVTAPISKAAWSLAGHAKYPGHTELFAARLRAKRHGMLFVSPRLRVMLATIHLPLMNLRDVLTIGKVFDAIDLGHEACVRLGVERPRVAVCGLNPHAGEGGLLGDEEERLIEPAILVAQENGIDARGPFPGDTVFNRAVRGEFDLVVAMYHDQGLIPVKLLAWDEAVNVTVGLPAPRTSPDHGTAFDIAGQNRADPKSFRNAVDLAIDLARG